MTNQASWSHVVGLNAVGRLAGPIALEADEAARRRIARLLDLAELGSLTATIRVEPWFDGAQIDAHWQADLVQTCGVTLDPLPSAPSGHFMVRIVPEGSVQAPSTEAEVSVDPDADDPPDVLEDDAIDLAAYVVEHLALALDPFPRKPGAEFEPPKDDADLSPFAVLRALKPPPQT